MVTQIEVDQELHTLPPSRLTLDWTMKEGRTEGKKEVQGSKEGRKEGRKCKGVRKDGRKEGSTRE